MKDWDEICHEAKRPSYDIGVVCVCFGMPPRRSFITEKHIAKLEGGEAVLPRQHHDTPPSDPRVSSTTHKNAEVVTGGLIGMQADEMPMDYSFRYLHEPQVPKHLKEGGGGVQQEGRPPLSLPAVALMTAFEELANAIVFPEVMQIVVGSDSISWNPVPLLWLGRSRRSGAILGLLTAVVWT